jgi:hypothetical protein
MKPLSAALCTINVVFELAKLLASAPRRGQ